MTIDQAYEHLMHALEAERLAQAYILVGQPKGAAGELAERLLRRLFCTAGPGAAPCGDCMGCRQAGARTHPDTLWLEPQKKSRIIDIAQIRMLQQRMQQTSYAGGWKAGVLVGADRLGAPAANAFLKTLEEPPGRGLFLLLTDGPQFLLPTILSRCQMLSVDDLPAELGEWGEALLAILMEPPIAAGRDAPGAATIAFGRAEQVVTLLKAMKSEAEDEEAELADEESVDETSETIAARGSARYRELRRGLIGIMLHWYRDLLVLVCGADESVVHFREHLDALRPQAATLTVREAMRHVRTIEGIERDLERFLPDSLVFAEAFEALAVRA